jgi:membrane-associated protein
MTITEIFSYFQVDTIVRDGGVPVMSVIVFAETGLLIGCFLPGDTMLFLAGVLAGTKISGGVPTTYFPLWELILCLSLAAIIGDQVGYFLGYECGPAIFSKKDGRIFKKAYATRAHDFYQHYGVFAVILARFIPILRTFVPFMAGVAQMKYPLYLVVDCFGGAIWISSIVCMGYVLGDKAQGHLPLILFSISFVSFIPLILGAVREYFNPTSKPNKSDEDEG